MVFLKRPQMNRSRQNAQRMVEQLGAATLVDMAWRHVELIDPSDPVCRRCRKNPHILSIELCNNDAARWNQAVSHPAANAFWRMCRLSKGQILEPGGDKNASDTLCIALTG